MKEERVFGYIPSKMNGTEHVFKSEVSVGLPKRYNYMDFMPNVIDQGELSICVPCSISAFINWKQNLKDGKVRDNGVNLMEIYNNKKNVGNGMTFKDAFSYLRHHGVETEVGNIKINEYARVNTKDALKCALVMNGPCVGALPVYNFESDFWIKKDENDRNFYGYHAISIVGYDDEGFIIRNSWGKDFGILGYTKIKYKDYEKLMELWTIL